MKKQESVNSTPFAVVVKYISAENFVDTLEARKYINISKVYSKYIDKENPTANKVWENQILFNQSLNNDKKFTNHFKFYNYDFEEVIKNKDAKVIFFSKKESAKIKSIEYSLELTDKNQWSITDIEYKN
jgi:hypothetical protein